MDRKENRLLGRAMSKSSVMSAGNEHISGVCSKCDGTGELWITCRDVGSISVRCSCSRNNIRAALIRFAVLESIAIAMVLVILIGAGMFGVWQ